MNRLQSEQQRLYGDGRAIVLSLAGRDAWAQLSRAWQGVQADLHWPAPGIAVSGTDAYQLWFSCAGPLDDARRTALIDVLRSRYLAEVPPERIATQAALPPREVAPGRWSAFVAPDLAAVFADEPCLDLPPGDEAQAELLSRLQSVKPADLARALDATAPPAHPQQDPRAFLLQVMNDPVVPLPLRIDAAKALLK